VDDEQRVADAISRVLADDYEVVIATRPREAVERLVATEFDVVLCDVLMPEMLGIDVYAAVARERPEIARRFVFMTGGVLPLRARDFLARVGNTCFDKPLEADKLRAIVKDRVEANKKDASRSGTFGPSNAAQAASR
jgi:DNA-binding NtrC family response regulator